MPDTIHKLGATTFVAAVTASTLSLLVPLLVRGLRDRSTPIKRKACLVIDNMSKLVNNPADAAVFLPRLQPGLDAVRKEVANPECREVADRAHATLLRVGAKGKVSTPSEQDKAVEAKVFPTLFNHVRMALCHFHSLLHYIIVIGISLCPRCHLEAS